MALSSLKPLHPEIRNPVSLQDLAAAALPNPGETVRTFLPQWHTVRKQLEEQEYQTMRAEYQKEHAKNFRYVLKRYHRM